MMANPLNKHTHDGKSSELPSFGLFVRLITMRSVLVSQSLEKTNRSKVKMLEPRNSAVLIYLQPIHTFPRFQTPLYNVGSKSCAVPPSTPLVSGTLRGKFFGISSEYVNVQRGHHPTTLGFLKRTCHSWGYSCDGKIPCMRWKIAS